MTVADSANRPDRTDRDDVRVLVVCGAPGTGKTVVAWELGHQLQSLGVPHAVLDTDELDRVWPQPTPVDALIAITRENLRAVWGTFSRLGTRHLVLSGVMASIPESRAWIQDALSGTTITFVRLTADRATREQRLRAREVGSGFDRDMRASDDVAAFVAEHDPPQVVTVATDSKTVLEVTREVLAAAGWVSASSPLGKVTPAWRSPK